MNRSTLVIDVEASDTQGSEANLTSVQNRILRSLRLPYDQISYIQSYWENIPQKELSLNQQWLKSIVGKFILALFPLLMLGISVSLIVELTDWVTWVTDLSRAVLWLVMICMFAINLIVGVIFFAADEHSELEELSLNPHVLNLLIPSIKTKAYCSILGSALIILLFIQGFYITGSAFALVSMFSLLVLKVSRGFFSEHIKTWKEIPPCPPHFYFSRSDWRTIHKTIRRHR